MIVNRSREYLKQHEEKKHASEIKTDAVAATGHEVAPKTRKRPAPLIVLPFEGKQTGSCLSQTSLLMNDLHKSSPDKNLSGAGTAQQSKTLDCD